MTSSAHDVGAVADFEVGRPTRVEIEGRGFVVVNAGTEFHVARDVCPHQGARLSAGLCKGEVRAEAVGGPVEYRTGGRTLLQCAWHGWIFDLSSGRALADPNRARVRVYPVRVADGRVLLSLA